MSAGPPGAKPGRAQQAADLLTGLLLALLILAWGMAYKGTLAAGWGQSLLLQTGQVGYLLLAASCTLGALTCTPWLSRVFSRHLRSGWHGVLSGFALALGALHGAFSLVGPRPLSLPGALVPGLAGLQTAAMAAGTLALWTLAAVYLSYALRNRLGMRASRTLHLLAYPAFAACTLHAVWVGHPGPLYILASLAVGTALALRLVALSLAPVRLALPAPRRD
ncbi:ferric reductase [Deinococcus sp.]|uniref:ferric reductase n=1 Tax=Deinococcus sp. TaxID=47478 RepID=UPI003CC63E76